MSKDLFTRYYKENIWRGKESLSGPGSDYEQTKYLIPELSMLFKTYDIKSVLDLPCGDFNWMKRLNLDDINYLGGDIVTDLIKSNRLNYGTKNIKFDLIDIVNDTLPKVDLIITRDCLVHLPNKDIYKALNNIKKSNSKYLLTTNFTWKSQPANADISVGQWRRINLELSPFNFPSPEYVLVEGNTQSNDKDKTMCLWNINNIPEYGL